MADLVKKTLLIMSIFAAIGPALLGLLMVLISVMFCDSGPITRCVEMGATMMGGLLLVAALQVPVIIVLTRQQSALSWYMYLYPFLMLAVAYIIYAKHGASLGLTKVMWGYGLLSMVAFSHLLFGETK